MCSTQPLTHASAVAQNVAEARYLVTLYQFLRLRGYPAHRISVLTTYNGQKALLRDEIEHRCMGTDFAQRVFGRPHKARHCPVPLAPLRRLPRALVQCCSQARAVQEWVSHAAPPTGGGLLAGGLLAAVSARSWARAGDHGGQVPGPAERHRAAVARAQPRRGARARREAPGGGHVQVSAGACNPALPDLARQAWHRLVDTCTTAR